MNWKAVRKHNAIRSQKAAQRKNAEAARKARIAEAGGPITLAEVKTATRRIDPPCPGHCHTREVWVMRGKEWRMGYEGGSFFPHYSYRQDPPNEGRLPVTPAAQKWLDAWIASQENTDATDLLP